MQIGGQAVIEGIMMRGPNSFSVAVRTQNNEVKVHKSSTKSTLNSKINKIPILRGFISLIDSLVLGIKALNISAEEYGGEEVKLSNLDIFIAMVMGIGLGILLFIVFPAFIARIIQNSISSALVVNILEGLVRIGVFLVYIYSFSFIRDIRRVFEYHGAEHKVIFTYEKGEPLTVENAEKNSRLHPRCGTNFLLIVMVVSILVFSLLGKQTLLWRIISRIILIPVVAGISYELIRLASKYSNSKIAKIITAPGLALQYLTTREPSQDQIEVAIEAVKSILALEGVPYVG
ncbi:MAG: DUF1385 domain-containing protein [Dictyoglomi bacterium]|jgi:uncharacterized protein YqhQ|nr:DUF1385 domain-containing protein [Dictyoglomota bacterium]HHV80675.1 DUF1385 domain-containing protein [bacterium]HOK30201.1 DUF1385 domain-containing protein [bacterium]HOL55267.1 DUF1385 domain-containing protein [bacterium]